MLSSRLIKNWSTIKPNSQLLLACQVALQINKTFFLSFPALKNGQISYRAWEYPYLYIFKIQSTKQTNKIF